MYYKYSSLLVSVILGSSLLLILLFYIITFAAIALLYLFLLHSMALSTTVKIFTDIVH
jgi:hypothetical protein